MSELQVQIRKATFKDLPQIIGILTKAGLPIEGIANHLKHFFIAENYGDAIGVCGVEVLNYTGLLRSMAVIGAFRNQGIGRSLVETALNYAQNLGLKELYLLTPSSKNYFSKLGFEEISREQAPHEIHTTQEFSELCVSATCMRMVL